MEQYYTVTGAKRLDGQDNYGNVTDSVFFKEHQGGVLWKHAPSTNVSEGTSVYGIIETLTSAGGKEYSKFTKKQLPEGTPAASNHASTSSNSGGGDGYDGAKRGMAINNAAAYVTGQVLKDDTRLEPEEFAAEVQRYAAAIYKIDPSVKSESDELLDFLNG